jgi:hypothetical protein
MSKRIKRKYKIAEICSGKKMSVGGTTLKIRNIVDVQTIVKKILSPVKDPRRGSTKITMAEFR